MTKNEIVSLIRRFEEKMRNLRADEIELLAKILSELPRPPVDSRRPPRPAAARSWNSQQWVSGDDGLHYK